MANDKPSGEPMPMQTDEFKSASARNLVSFNVDKINPPSLLYIQRDDQLTVLAQSFTGNVQITLIARLLLADSKDIVTIERDILIPSSLTLTTAQIPLAEGYLLSVAVKTGVSVLQQCDTLVHVLVTRGAIAVPFNTVARPARVLISDYVTSTHVIGWPDGRIVNFGDGPGSVQSVLIPTPGAGNDFTVVVPNTVLWEVQSFSITFTTSVAVANRAVQLVIGSGGTTDYTGQPSQVIPASTVATVSGCQAEQPFNTLVTDVTVVVPPRNLLIGGDQIRSLTSNIQATDAFTSGRMRVRQWVGLG